MASNRALPKYKYINLDDADNGYILRYEERLPKPVKDTYGETNYISREKVFQEADGDAAFDEFKKLHMENRDERKKAIEAAEGK